MAHQAVQIRLTPAIKQALLQAQASGQPVSLSVPNLRDPAGDVRSQQAILRVGDQEHVFHMAKESHTSALIRLPRSPVHPGAPVTSSAQVTAKLKPQQTLDQGTKERVRALGQEAAAKQKQRAAVMLNGKAAERAATGKPAVTKTVRQATPPPPPAPAVTPFAAATQPPQQQQQPQRRAISPPATAGASTGAGTTAPAAPKQRPASASTPTPPPAPGATTPPPGAEKGGGGSTGGPPGASTASGAAAAELPPAAILAAKERALELVIVALMGSDRAVSNTGLYQRVDAAYKVAAQKMESREHLKRVVDMLTERIPPNRLKLKQSALEQYQPRLAALQSKAGPAAPAGVASGDKASERPPLPLAPASAADKPAAPSRKRPAGDSTGAAAAAAAGSQGPGSGSAKAAGAAGAAGSGGSGGVKRQKPQSKEAGSPPGSGAGAGAGNSSGPPKKKKKTMSLNAGAQGSNIEEAAGKSGSAMNGTTPAKDGSGAAGPAAKKQKTGPGPGDKAKKVANGAVKGKAVVEKKSAAPGAAAAAGGEAGGSGGGAAAGPANQAGAGKEAGADAGGAGAAGAATQPASDQQAPVRKGGSKKKPKASFRQLGISNWEEDEEDQQGYAGLQARQRQQGYPHYGPGPGWMSAGGSASAPAALDQLGSGGISQGVGGGQGHEEEEEEWEVEEDVDWQAIQWGAAPTPQGAEDAEEDEEQQQVDGVGGVNGGGGVIPQPPPPPPIPPAKGGVPVMGEVAVEEGVSQPSPSPPPVLPSPTSVLPVPEYVEPPAPGIQLPPMPPPPPIQLPVLLAGRSSGARSRGATPSGAGNGAGAKARASAAPVKGGGLGAGVGEDGGEDDDEGEDELWERVEVLEDDPADREVYARYINWAPPPPGSYAPLTSPEDHAALERDFKDKYNAYYMAHQKYNSVMRKLEALRESADTAAAQGDARLASILHRQLWFEAACNYVLLRTWQRVVSALESDLNTLRGLAADYVTKTTAGAGHTLAGAGQPPRMAGGRAVRVA